MNILAFLTRECTFDQVGNYVKTGSLSCTEVLLMILCNVPIKIHRTLYYLTASQIFKYSNCLMLCMQPVFVDDPFSRKNDTPALPPKKSIPPRPKPPSGKCQTRWGCSQSIQNINKPQT